MILAPFPIAAFATAARDRLRTSGPVMLWRGCGYVAICAALAARLALNRI